MLLTADSLTLISAVGRSATPSPATTISTVPLCPDRASFETPFSVCGVPAGPLYDPLAKLEREQSHVAPLRTRNAAFSSRAEHHSPRSICVLSAELNVLLSIFKLIAGTLTGSRALIADAYHSCSDLVSDGLAMLASMTPSLERPCTLGIAGMLLMAGASMLCSSAAALREALKPPEVAAASFVWNGGALAVALVSIVSKEWLFRITRDVGQRANSPSTIANAHHHRSDAMSSIAAAVGIVGALLGVSVADTLAAAVVGAMVMKTGLTTAREAAAA